MKKPWDSFEKNYVAVETADERTGKTKLRYEYCGPWFVCKNEAGLFKRAKRRAGIALAVNAAAVLWAGSVDSILNRSGLTSLPYGLALAALIFTGMGGVLFLVSGARVKRPEYERMNHLLRIAAPVEAGLLGLALLAGAYLAVNGSAAGRELLPLCGYLLGACASLALYFAYRGLRFREEKNTEFEYASDPLCKTPDRGK